MNILLDAAPLAGGIGVFAAVAFLFIFFAAAFVVFKLLKRTVRMAFRITIVFIILAVAIMGSFALWALGTGSSERPRPRPTRAR